MKKHLIILGIAILLLAVGLSGCNEQLTENGKSNNSSFFIISGNITNYYTGTPKIEVNFAISTEDNEWNYLTANENTTILLHSMTISSFNYSIKSDYPRYNVKISWQYLDGGYGETSSISFTNSNNDNISCAIEIKDNKEIEISIISPKSIYEQLNDELFRVWILSATDTITNDANNLEYATSIYDFNLIETYGDRMHDHMDNYLYEIEAYNVSSKWLAIKTEFHTALHNYKWVGYWSKRGAETANSELYDLANDYFGYAVEYALKGVSNIDTCRTLLKQIS